MTVSDEAKVRVLQQEGLRAPLLLLANADKLCQACRGCSWMCATRPRTTSCPRCRCCAWPRSPRSPGSLWATGSARLSTWPRAARALLSCCRCTRSRICASCVCLCCSAVHTAPDTMGYGLVFRVFACAAARLASAMFYNHIARPLHCFPDSGQRPCEAESSLATARSIWPTACKWERMHCYACCHA